MFRGSVSQPASNFSEQKSGGMRGSVVLLGSERELTSEIWVVDLDVAEAVIVEDLQLRLVCFGDIGKIFLVAGVDVFRERATLCIACDTTPAPATSSCTRGLALWVRCS